MKELNLRLDDDLYRYLSLLEKMKFIESKEEAVVAAVRIFKKLNMHEWLPYVYRAGSERVLLMGQGLLYDIFSSVSEARLYDVARISALKRKMLKPFDPELDLSDSENWDVILNEIQDYGWGKITRHGEEIMVEFLGVPIIFLRGYLESIFKVRFKTHSTKIDDVYVLSKEHEKTDVWF